MARIALLAALVLLVSGCGERRDMATLEIAESLPIADLEIESGTRTVRAAVPGRPNASFSSFAEVVQAFEPIDDSDAVLDELRRLVEADGWVIELEGEDPGHWRTAERTIDGRTFLVRAAIQPQQEGLVTMWLEEKKRTSS